jgi:hydroxymethylglutaryl-CoA synthase
MSVKAGIDSLAIYTSRYALDLQALATERGFASSKYQDSLSQFIMSVPPPGEDIVTMAANAAQQALRNINLQDVAMLLFATESGIDQSKSAGIYAHHLLGLSAQCRVVELKQACYSATAALQLALPWVRENPGKKILVVAADIARYGLKTNAESSQGGGAVAFVLSTNPRVLAFDKEYCVLTDDVMDFWRPNYMDEALVEGKYSSKLYLSMLEKTWQQYSIQSRRGFADHAYFCYHTPVPRLVEKAHQYVAKCSQQTELTEAQLQQQLAPTLCYSQQIGNSYAASLYIGLASLLDKATDDLSGQRIGFYSYGSGCVAEFFSGVVQPGYQAALHTDYHQFLLANRTMLNCEEYEHFYRYHYNETGAEQMTPEYDTGLYRLTKMQQHKRIYERVDEAKVAAA